MTMSPSTTPEHVTRSAGPADVSASLVATVTAPLRVAAAALLIASTLSPNGWSGS